MKKAAFLLTALLGTSYVSADMPSSSGSQMDSCAWMKQPMGEIAPSVAPSSCMKVALSADFIWWKTTISGLEYAASGVTNGAISVGSTTSVEKGHLKSPGFDYQPGFKVGLGFLMGHDGWDLNAEYTWLNPNTQTNSVDLDSAMGLASSFDIVLPSGTGAAFALSEASTSLTNHYNVLDVMLGRDFFVSKFLSLNPQIGGKFAWTKNKYSINYDYLTGESFGDSSLDLKQSLFGTGIRAGLGSTWNFSKHWSLYGDLAFSGLWSFIKTSETQVTDDITTVNTTQHIQQLVNVVEWGIGFDYTTWIYDNDCQFTLRAGWEQQAWIHAANFIDTNYVSTSDMNIQGLTVKADFRF
jgi:hypothetical protein